MYTSARVSKVTFPGRARGPIYSCVIFSDLGVRKTMELHENTYIFILFSRDLNCGTVRFISLNPENRDGASADAVDAAETGDAGGTPGSEVVNFPDFVRVLAHFKPLKKNAEKNKLNSREEKLRCE